MEQALLLDKVLEDMDNLELNAQLKALADKKQDLLERIQALEKDEAQRDLQAVRQRKIEAWLEQRQARLTEYDDTLTRKFVEQVAVIDAETIRVKIKDVDVVITRKLS